MNKQEKQEIFHCNFFPKNRRGFLLGEETIKIVVAVIAIVFLIALLASIYFSVTDNQKVKEAQAIISGENGLSREIERINSGGELSEQGFFVPNPSDWYIFSFTGEKKPNLCTGINCICICGKVLADIFDGQIKECDKKGFCSLVQNLKEFEKIKIEKAGVVISIRKVDTLIEVSKK